MDKIKCKKGKYYYEQYNSGQSFICLSSGGIYTKFYIHLQEESFEGGGQVSDPKILRLATKKEEHWLKECIKANTFIEEKEAMKSFKKIIEIW